MVKCIHGKIHCICKNRKIRVRVIKISILIFVWYLNLFHFKIHKRQLSLQSSFDQLNIIYDAHAKSFNDFLYIISKIIVLDKEDKYS